MNTKKLFKSKILLTVLIGIMALSIIPMVAFMEGTYTAAVGDTQFQTLEDAFTYAQSQGGNVEIELLTDATVEVADLFSNYNGITLTGGNITLDLNGHTVDGVNAAGSSTDKSSVFFVSGNSSLTITDSIGGGRIEKNCNDKPAITVGGNAALTIESGEIESNVGAGIVVKGGTLTVDGGKIKGYNAGIHVNGGTLKVTGNAEIYGKYSNAVLIESGSAQLSGGTYTTDESDMHSIWNSGGSAAELLAEGYRYGDGNGNEAAFSSDAETHGVKMEKGGKTVVEPLPPEGIPYIGADGELSYCSTYEELTGTYANIRGNKWYVLTESMTKNYAFSIFGSANLILCDGATLTLDTLKGAIFDGDSSLVLNIYLQGGGTGKLIVKNGLVASSEGKLVTINLISPGMKMVDKDGNPTNGAGSYFEISSCTDHVWEYKNQTDATHDRVCTLCGTTETGIAHTLKSWQSKDKDDRFHYKVCECGTAYEKKIHVFERSVPNSDGLTCTPVCSTCKYERTPQDHEFIEVTTTDGDKLMVCKNCYAELAAEYKGKQYTSIRAAIDALSNMPDSEKYGTVKTGTVTIVAPEFVTENVVVNDPDMVLTIDLGGKEWRADISGEGPYIPLTVEKGWVILKNGKLWQGSSSSSAYAGIVVTGGSLRVAENTSISGGRWDKDVLRPSIDLQGGRLELAAGVTLLTGLKVPEDSTLNDYLPKGTAFVKCQMDYENRSVIIPEPYEYITDIYDTNESTASIAIVAHEHVTDEHGKCTQCAKQAYFAILTKADGTTENISSFADGWAAAIANEGSTLTLLCDVDLGSSDTALEADSGKFTLDLAGFSLKCYSRTTLIDVNGTADITIKNGRLINTVYGVPGDGQLYQNNANAITVYGGKVALEHVEATGGSGEYDWKQCFSITVYDGKFTVVDCTFNGLVVVYRNSSTSNPTVKITSATLHHGLEYTGIIDDVQDYYKVVKALFADNSRLFTPDGQYIDITDNGYWNIISDGITIAFFTYDKEAVIKLHTHTTDECGKCTVCREQVYVAVLTMADGTTKNFSSFADGWAAAIANKGSTLKLLCDVDLGSGEAFLGTDAGIFTLDLGGFSLKGSAEAYLFYVINNIADVTIKNGKLINTAIGTSEFPESACAIYVRTGKLTLENVEVIGGVIDSDGKPCNAVVIDGGELAVIDSSFTGAIYVYKRTLDTNIKLKITSATLNNGIVYRGVINVVGDYEKYWQAMEVFFADGSVLLDPDGKYIDVTADDYWQVTSEAGSGEALFTYNAKLIVEQHTHTTDKNGKCTTCGMQVYVAVLTKADGTTERVSTLEEGLAAAAANKGSTLTLLCDVDLRGEAYFRVESGKFTLELAGFSITGKAQYGVIWIRETADITIKNGKLINICKEATKDGGHAIVVYGGKATLDGVDVRGSYGDAQCYSVEVSGGGELIVRSGSFTGAIAISGGYSDATLKIISATLGNGIRFEYLNFDSTISRDEVYKIVKGFMADGSVLLDSNGMVIDITANSYWTGTDSSYNNRYTFQYSNAAVVHAHTVDEHGKCTTCDMQVYVAILTKADGTTKKFSSFKEGWAEAIANEGSTLKLLCDVEYDDSRNITLEVSSGRFTLDLANFSLKSNAYGGLLVVSGTADITIKNGKLIDTVYKESGNQVPPSSANAIVMNGGKVTLDHVEVIGGQGAYDNRFNQCYAVLVQDGELIVLSGEFTGAVVAFKMTDEMNPIVRIISATLHQGIMYGYSGSSRNYEAVKALFADGSLFFDSNGKYIDVTSDDRWTIEISEEYSMVTFVYEEESIVKPHTHTVNDEDWVVDVDAALCRKGSRHGACSDCGALISEVIPAIGFDEIEVGHNCSFGEDLSMMYAIPMGYFDGCTNIRLVVTKENGGIARTLDFYRTDMNGKLYYCFVYTGVSAKEMGDKLTAVLKFTRDGVEYSGTVDIYSLKDYAMERLAHSSNPQFKKLLVSLLNYGAAAQIYFEYRTDALVNADLTAEQNALSSQTYGMVTAADAENGSGETTYPAAITGKNVVFGNRITFLVATSFTEESELEGVALRIRYTDSKGNEVITTVDGSKFVYRSDVGCYAAYFDGLKASELRTTLELTLVQEDGEAISETVTYNFDTYVQNRLAKSKSESFKALLEATLIYADSANEYFSNVS